MPDAGDPFSDEKLALTAREFAGVGSDSSQPNDVRFVRGVAKIVRKLLDQEQPGTAGGEPAVFLMHAALPNSVSPADVVSHPMFDNGRTPVVGQVWLVGPAVVSGSSITYTPGSDEDLFSYVIEDLDLGGTPAVIFDPRAGTDLRFYPAGLQARDEMQLVPAAHGTVTLERVFGVVQRVRDAHLVTPDAQSEVAKIWQAPSKHWVASHAELAIQMYLSIGLSVEFPLCRVLAEQPQVTGRIDIEIEETDTGAQGAVVRHVLLELKVLRDYGSTGSAWSKEKTARWIGEGIDQASAYANERGSAAKALCCFDMRKEPPATGCFSLHMTRKAARLGVQLASW